jgi:hypothetical protein
VTPKPPSILSRIFNDVREVIRRDQKERLLTNAVKFLEKGDSAPMERLAQTQLGDAWLALANYYASHQPQEEKLATDAYRNAAECNTWLHRSYIAEEEFDRRCFLGIGITQDFSSLAKKWKNFYESGSQRETELAWIHAFGPVELRDKSEAWWWVALAEERWGQLRDAQLPSSSAAEIREHLIKSVPKKERLKIQLKAKEYAYQDFVRGK